VCSFARQGKQRCTLVAASVTSTPLLLLFDALQHGVEVELPGV
jgi:hypothetical protein